jgi:hypothetical protein
MPLNVPIGHGEHIVLSSDAYLPEEQGEQNPDPGAELTKPGSHASQPCSSGAPVVVNLPMGQSKHVLLVELK